MSLAWVKTNSRAASSSSSPWPEEKRTMPPSPGPNDDTDVDELPRPVLARPKSKSVAGSTSTKQKKSARIEDTTLRVHWARLRRRLGTGTSPSTNDSLLDESAGDGSIGRHVAAMTGKYDEDDEVNEVIVERQWSDELKSSVSVSEQDGTPSKSHSHSHAVGGTATDHESMSTFADGFWGSWTPLIILRWRVWPFFVDFFSLRFYDAKAEARYLKENWFMRKSLALWASVFLILNWVLAVIFVPGPRVLADYIFYYGAAPALTFPILLMVMYDFPRDRPTIYQIVLTTSIWSWTLYQLFYIYFCGFYTSKRLPDGWLWSCGNKDFLATFYYAVGLPTIGLFGLRLKRLPALIGTCVCAGVMIGTILPVRSSWTRNVLNFLVFQFFLIYVHYMLETSERRLYELRDQLKTQFRATQKAQVNERKAGDSKRRLTSYVFHEVRVPLNTALLATQNMAATNETLAEEIEFKALEGSLSTMSKVLNDVLDFNRMDSGRFESVSRPYTFHQVMRGLFVPLRLATDARGLDFVTDLDVRIDRVARFAALTAKGLKHEDVLRELEACPDADGVLVGDETRLMQIVTNLASNACKFTPPGGQLRVSTRLILPLNVWTPQTKSDGQAPRASDDSEISEKNRAEMGLASEEGGLNADSLNMHNLRHSKPPEVVVVRIEVQDTGYGIPPKEMAQSKLFSAFNQTEQGKQQGGKGTGLGLALVRQIVKRSGGRLGVISKVGRGSTFWVELPLGVGPKAIVQPHPHEIANRQGATTVAAGLISRQLNESGVHRNVSAKRTSDGAAEADLYPEKPKLARPTSVMHSIMDQGGLVELTPKPAETAAGAIITRTLADTLLPSTASLEDVLPRPNSMGLHDTASGEDTPKANGAPQHIDLPPPLFNPVRPRVVAQDSATSETTFVDTPGFAPLAPPEVPPAVRATSEPTIEPRRPPARAPPAVASSPGLTKPQKPKKDADTAAIPPGMDVLVVDDDPLTRMLMTRLLTRLGCQVATAENGELALEMILGPSARPTPGSEQQIRFADDTSTPRSESSHALQQQQLAGTESKYAIVFLDNQMPVLSGVAAVARLRELGRDDFVVGVTGNALLSDQEEYLEAGVDHVLTKPVLERNLKSMLLRAAERRQSRMGAPGSSKDTPPDLTTS